MSSVPFNLTVFSLIFNFVAVVFVIVYLSLTRGSRLLKARNEELDSQLAGAKQQLAEAESSLKASQREVESMQKQIEEQSIAMRLRLEELVAAYKAEQGIRLEQLERKSKFEIEQLKKEFNDKLRSDLIGMAMKLSRAKLQNLSKDEMQDDIALNQIFDCLDGAKEFSK